jgi:broad specificity phosphatase PhoE
VAAEDIAAIEASPLRRTQETAAEIAAACGLGVHTQEALNELDFGEWTSRRFVELVGDPDWENWNSRRSAAAPPKGESMIDAQKRVMRHIRDCPRRYPDGIVAMVTHCDIIRAVVAAVLGLSLDHILQFDVEPASVSRIVVGDWGARLLSLNEFAA